MSKKIKYCKVCGASSELREFISDVCNKHYQQFFRYGKYLDSNPRGVNDPNEIIQYEDYAEIILYNMKNEEVSRTKIDLEDVEKCKSLKWRINDKSTNRKQKLYCYSGSGKGNQLPLHRYLINCLNNMEIDHINSDSLDNRKANLRIVTHSKNLFNKELSNYKDNGFTGISYDRKNKQYKTEISANNKRYYFKNFNTIEECIYLRYLMELFLFKDMRNKNNDENIFEAINKLSEAQKQNIKDYLKIKLGVILVSENQYAVKIS